MGWLRGMRLAKANRSGSLAFARGRTTPAITSSQSIWMTRYKSTFHLTWKSGCRGKPV